MRKVFTGLTVLAFATVIFVGCAAFNPYYVHTVNDVRDAECIVTQYSGGKEIGKWYLNRKPIYDSRDTWISFGNFDTVITLGGDLRMYKLNK